MTTANEFMQRIKGQRITDVALLDGSPDMDASECQFQIETEDGYNFVASGNEAGVQAHHHNQEQLFRQNLHSQEE